MAEDTLLNKWLVSVVLTWEGSKGPAKIFLGTIDSQSLIVKTC